MTGRELPPTSAFSGDDGSADPTLAAVLRAYGRTRSTGSGDPRAVAELADVIAALAGTRVLVPVLAEAEATETVEVHGHAHTVDRQASAGIVALQAPDGRTALPVFSSVAAMTAWRADARPVPTEIARAALSAVEEGWELLVLDPGGPVTVLVPRPAVWALAQQIDWSPAVTGTGADRIVAPEVRDAVREAITAAVAVGDPAPAAAATEQPRRWWRRSAPATSAPTTERPAIRELRVVPGDRAEVSVDLHLVPGLDRGTVDAVLRAVGAALAGSETVTRRVDSVQVRLR
ncbi:SseB family protein [Cellulomonas taurus]|uniref:SseB family protein n=1 Tax=Cellulomonas taurus TaxID=2729175 RepID=UPI00145D130C|nr:SseB family protein [Cellulomonas taurus]